MLTGRKSEGVINVVYICHTILIERFLCCCKLVLSYFNCTKSVLDSFCHNPVKPTAEHYHC